MDYLLTEDFLANVNSRSRSLLSPVRRLYVCNASAPYSGGWNFRQFLYGIWYIGHPLTSVENFYGDHPRGTPPSKELYTRGVAKYSDFGPIEGYISETVQDRR